MLSQHNKDLIAKLQAKIAAASAATSATAATQSSVTQVVESTEVSTPTHLQQSIDRYGSVITYNEKQQEFINLVRQRKSCVLIGAAGTGKTTCMRGTIETLMQECYIPALNAPHKHLHAAAPGIAVISYTRRAVSNIRRALADDMKGNCITYHKLMEYEPVFYTVTDPETGQEKNTMKFEPTRNQYHTLPENLKCIIVEEASMLSVEYWNLIVNALAHETQVIFLGDIYQLPPVFGAAILGYKLNELPVVELTEVYRQALNSPIISYAHKIKNGEKFTITEKEVVENEDGKVTLHPWKKKLLSDDALTVTSKFFTHAHSTGIWNPESDIILMPFNKAYGTIELNKHLATYLASLQSNPVFEIIAGFNKIYLRVGERVMVDKEDATVVSITRNATYLGAKFQKESVHMDYWGAVNAPENSHHIAEFDDDNSDDVANVDFILEQLANTSEEDRVHTASHNVVVQLDQGEREVTLTTAAELNNLLLGYAITVHKAQGSEWDKVFLLFHRSHATMLSRELLYTAMTRAKKEIYCICEKDTFYKGVLSQRIKGTTLAEKAEYFKGKALEPGVEIL